MTGSSVAGGTVYVVTGGAVHSGAGVAACFGAGGAECFVGGGTEYSVGTSMVALSASHHPNLLHPLPHFCKWAMWSS